MSSRSLQGHLLIATPQLLDPNFVRSVLLIFEHTPEGAAGLILNRLTEMTVSELGEEVFQEPVAWEKAIHLGGPVAGILTILHAEPDLADRETCPGIYLTADPEKILEIVRKKIEPSLVLANYAGWGPGQLDRELREDSWFTTPATREQIFGDPDRDLWDSIARQLRKGTLADLLRIPIAPDDPSKN